MFREKFSAVLLSLGFILALLPLKETRSFNIKPEKLLKQSVDRGSYLTADQVAKMVWIAKEMGVEPASPDDARKILGLKGIRKVNY